jgi:hypothetical protein
MQRKTEKVSDLPNRYHKIKFPMNSQHLKYTLISICVLCVFDLCHYGGVQLIDTRQVECQLNKACAIYHDHTEYSKVVLCNNFDKLDELEKLSFAAPSCAKYTNLTCYELYPQNQIILSNKVNIEKINDAMFSSLMDNTQEKTIQFKNFQGIDVELFQNQTVPNKMVSPIVKYTYQDSTFDFYYKGKLIGECDETAEVFRSDWNLFGQFQFLFLGGQVEYNTKICPLLFRNSFLFFFQANAIVDHFIQKNLLVFADCGNRSLNTQVREFRIDGSLINQALIQNTLMIDIAGQIKSIDLGVFKSLINSHSIEMQLTDFKSLFQKIGLK